MQHPLLTSLHIPERGKVVSAREAVSLIRSGDTVATSGFVAVFHLFTILVNVVEPEAIRICRTRLWKRCIDSSSTRRKH